jgi:uncharacterized protein YjbI with pentapeptide repeats
MTNRPQLQSFLELSAHLTGFDTATLLGTGKAEHYHDLLCAELGPAGLETFLSAAATGTGGEEAAASAQRLIRLWYLGLWNNEQIDAQSYREGLIWKAIDANPPGSRPPGYGTWALEPPLRAALARGLAALLLVVALLFGWGGEVQAASDADLLRLEQARSCNRCDLSAATLSHTDLYAVAITASDLSGADLSGSLMNDARLVQSTLVGANLQEAFLTGADLSGSVLSGADLRRSRLTNTIMRSTVLREAQLDGADLSSADLRQAQLAGAHLNGARLAGSSLVNADLSNSDLRDADLRHADLRQARLDGAVLCGADLNEALMPDGHRGQGPAPAC